LSRPARSTLAAALLAALREHGAREIFGIPGDFALGLFDAIEREGTLPLYTLSHEPSIGFAADAAARIHGAPSVAAVTYGAGALNMVNAVAAAYAEKSPVVVLSGSPGRGERASGLSLHHQARTLDSQLAIFREITCDQAVLDESSRPAEDIARVLASARRCSRPVYLEIPRDRVEAPCEAVVAQAPAPIDADALAACAEEIMARLVAAQRPVLMAGVEVRRFGLEERVAALARRLGIPVVTSLLGRGLFAGADTPLAGTYLGPAGNPAVAEMVEESDALFLLGEIVSDTTFGVSGRRVDLRHAIQALDNQVVISHHTYFDIALAALVDALGRSARPLASARRAESWALPANLAADGAPVEPRDIAAGVNDLMARHGLMPVAADIGDCLFTAMELVHTDHVAPGYYATMGFGVPAALGVQAATGRRALALVGDGAFQMTGWELGHCRRYGWDPIVVVMNNARWGMLSAFRPQAGYTALGEWDFAGCAAPLGGRGHRVATREELARALEAAAAERGRFHLIDVRMAPGALSSTLRRFADAIGSFGIPAKAGMP
jgi:indolepyruvate decarboxylase